MKQKSKYQPVKIRNNPCKSVAKKIKMRIAACNYSFFGSKRQFMR
jgi:hypothetical protein